MAPGQFELTYVRGDFWAGDPTRRTWLRAHDPVHWNEPAGDEEVFPDPFTFDIERVRTSTSRSASGSTSASGTPSPAWSCGCSPRPEGPRQSVGGA
jgi:hypothetical protein